MPVCDHCGADTDRFRYTCNWCELTLCPGCRLPENHDCDGTDQISDAHRPMGPNDTGLTLRGGSPQPTPPAPSGSSGYTGGGLGWRWRLRRWGSKLWTIFTYIAILVIVVGMIGLGFHIANDTIGDDLDGQFGDFLDAGEEVFSPPALNQSEAETALFEEIEQVRAENMGLRFSLNRHDYLSHVAREHAEDMVERDFYDHINPDGAGPNDRVDGFCRVSEILAQSYWHRTVDMNDESVEIESVDTLVESLVDSWLSSADHREILLDPVHLVYGVGVAYDDDDESVYAVALFC